MKSRRCLLVLMTLLGMFQLGLPLSVQAQDPAGSEGGSDCQKAPTSSCTPVDASGNPVPDAAQNLSQPYSQAGNPVSIITGHKSETETDYQSRHSKLSFQRFYSSDAVDRNRGNGNGWSSTYSSRLVAFASGGYALEESTGRRLLFTTEQETEDGKTVYKALNPSSGSVWTDGDRYFWSIPDGRLITFAGSYPVRIDYPGNQFLTLFYQNGKLAEVSDEFGSKLQFEYYSNDKRLGDYETPGFSHAPGHLARLILPDSSAIHYFYDRKRNFSRATYADSTSRTFHYEDEAYPLNLTGITDRLDKRYAYWNYDEYGQVSDSEYTGGAGKLTFAYFPPDDKTGVGTTTIQNSLGYTNTYTWQNLEDDAQTLLLSSEGPGCFQCPKPNMRYSYNDAYQVEIAANKSGEETRHEYDEQGRLSAVFRVAANGVQKRTLFNEYEGDNYKPFRISRPSVNPQGWHVTTIEFSDDSLPVKITESGFAPVTGSPGEFSSVERTTSFSYENGKVSSIDGPRTNADDITRFSYDQIGRLADIRFPSGQKMQVLSYDEHGRITRLQQETQSPAAITYDIHGNVDSIEIAGAKIEYRYDAKGQLVGLVDAYGRESQVRYDEAGRMTSLTDELGLVTEFVSDSENRITDKLFYGLNGQFIRSINYVFDAEGRLASQTEQSINGSTGEQIITQEQLDYDEFGQLIGITDSESNERKDLSYGPFGELLSLGESGELGEQHGYDNKGHPSHFTDAKGNKTIALHDDFGRVVSLDSPDTGLSVYAYDEAGNRTSKINADGDITLYEWDAANRLVRTERNDDTVVKAFHETNGKLILAQNNSSKESFRYDREARLISHKRHFGSQVFETGYEYNRVGTLVKKRLPDGQVLRYHYHESGINIGSLRAITRESLLGLSQETIVAEIDSEKRDGNGGFISHNGMRNDFSYHANGDISSIEISDTVRLEYRFDNKGRISGISENGAAYDYRYDRGNLVEAHTRLGSFYYEYDAISNRTADYAVYADGDVSETSYSYEQGSRLQQSLDHVTGLSNTYEYNGSGSPLKAGRGIRYEYNSQQRPVRVYADQKLLAEYTYNSFGERDSKTVYGATTAKTYFLYDGNSLVGEINNAGVVTKQYVYLPDGRPVAMLDKQEINAIHTDHLGTPQRVTDSGANSVWSASYTPFGRANIIDASVTMNLRFPGQYEDSETRTHYNYYRDYDPATGRYITSDPIGLQGGENTYAYVAGNPLNSIDPLGLAVGDVDDTRIMLEDGKDKPVVEASYLEKLNFVLEGAKAQLIADSQHAIAAFLTPKNIAIMAGMIAGIAALQLVPGVNVVVNTVLMGLTFWNLGAAGIKFIREVIGTAVDVYDATTASSLCNAGGRLGKALVQLLGAGLDALPAGKSRKLTKFLEKARDRAKAKARANDVDPEKPNRPNCGLRSNGPISSGFAGGIEGTSGSPCAALAALSVVERKRVEAYVAAVYANKKLNWNKIDPNSTDTQRKKARRFAKEHGLIPKIEVDPVTKYADFSEHAIATKQLPPEFWDKPVHIQEKELNKMLEGGKKPEGYTWHHHQDDGKMELVPLGVHDAYYHKGGCTTWATNCDR